MNWLLTYCDGSSGYKVGGLYSPEGASQLLQKVKGWSKALADEEANDPNAVVIQLEEIEQVLYPVPPLEEALDDYDYYGYCEEDDDSN